MEREVQMTVRIASDAEAPDLADTMKDLLRLASLDHRVVGWEVTVWEDDDGGEEKTVDPIAPATLMEG